MTGKEIVRQLEKNRIPTQSFIKWWQQEESSPNYEMVQDFLEDVSADEEFSGYKILDLEEMWETLEKMDPDRISRETRASGEFIIWTHHSGAGEMVVEECPFSSESVIMIYDIETNPRQGHSFGTPKEVSKHKTSPD